MTTHIIINKKYFGNPKDEPVSMAAVQPMVLQGGVTKLRKSISAPNKSHVLGPKESFRPIFGLERLVEANKDAGLRFVGMTSPHCIFIYS